MTHRRASAKKETGSRSPERETATTMSKKEFRLRYPPPEEYMRSTLRCTPPSRTAGIANPLSGYTTVRCRRLTKYCRHGPSRHPLLRTPLLFIGRECQARFWGFLFGGCIREIVHGQIQVAPPPYGGVGHRCPPRGGEAGGSRVDPAREWSVLCHSFSRCLRRCLGFDGVT